MHVRNPTTEIDRATTAARSHRPQRFPRLRHRGRAAAVIGLAMASIAVTSVNAPATAAPGPVGNGFHVTAGDLSFILKQIKIAERHAATFTAAKPCSTLVNSPTDGIPQDDQQVPDILTSYGLRTVDGSCNNLKTGDEYFAASDQVFPRLTNPVWRPSATQANFPVPTSASYLGTGNVVDTQPRVVSNLIVDQTSTNPAAVAASGHPVRSQIGGTPSSVPCTTEPVL